MRWIRRCVHPLHEPATSKAKPLPSGSPNSGADACETSRLGRREDTCSCSDGRRSGRSTGGRERAAVQRLQAFLADFRTRVLPQTQAVLTLSRKTPEARLFLQEYPDARQITLRYAGRPYYVLLRDH